MYLYSMLLFDKYNAKDRAYRWNSIPFHIAIFQDSFCSQFDALVVILIQRNKSQP